MCLLQSQEWEERGLPRLLWRGLELQPWALSSHRAPPHLLRKGPKMHLFTQDVMCQGRLRARHRVEPGRDLPSWASCFSGGGRQRKA